MTEKACDAFRNVSKYKQEQVMNTERKKILYVITKSNFGGAQRYVYDLATNLPSDQYNVLVAAGGNGELFTKLAKASVPTTSSKSAQRNISLFKEFVFFFELLKLFRKEKPDIVHLNSSKAGGLGALAGRLAGARRIVFTAHGWPFLEPRNILWRSVAWIGSWLTALLSHKVIIVSQNDNYRARMPLVKRKCTVIRTAVPLINFLARREARDALFNANTQSEHSDSLWLITNAELNYNKNLFAAIDAVVQHNAQQHQKIFYSIISDGVLREKLEAYIQSKNAASYITLLGYIDDARIYSKAFDAFLLPSKKEGMPYALLEAGAAGLPVIASNVGGIPEVIENRKTGILIDPNDTDTIASALEEMTNNIQNRENMAQNLSKKVLEQFSLSKMLEETYAQYQ